MKVSSEFVRKPSIPASFPPADYVEARPVTAEDDWWKLQNEFGLADPWDLIWYNFRTRDPKEVNWYMETYLGCDTITLDRKNYRFSGTNAPGIVYIPPSAEPGSLRVDRIGSRRWAVAPGRFAIRLKTEIYVELLNRETGRAHTLVIRGPGVTALKQETDWLPANLWDANYLSFTTRHSAAFFDFDATHGVGWWNVLDGARHKGSGFKVANKRLGYFANLPVFWWLHADRDARAGAFDVNYELRYGDGKPTWPLRFSKGQWPTQ